jgi:hypothetical protein
VAEHDADFLGERGPVEMMENNGMRHGSELERLMRTQACASSTSARGAVSIRERSYPRHAALAANKSKFMKGNERKNASISFHLFF